VGLYPHGVISLSRIAAHVTEASASVLSHLSCRAAEAVLKGQVETIVSFHIQNISNSKSERSTAPLVCCLALEWWHPSFAVPEEQW
jgi:hypothetical protein